jgi:hypothetical protein
MAPDDLVGRIEDVYVVATNASFTWVEARTCYVQRGHDGGRRSCQGGRVFGIGG